MNEMILIVSQKEFDMAIKYWGSAKTQSGVEYAPAMICGVGHVKIFKDQK